MLFFFLFTGFIFLALAIFTLFAPDILLRVEKAIDKPVLLLTRDMLVHNKKKRSLLFFLFILASFFVFVILFSGAYKGLIHEAPRVDYQVK